MPARRKAKSKPPKARHRKATRDPTPEEEYQIRSILDEKVERGKLLYLIDWEDSPEGQTYDPTWEPAKHVNEVAINEWEAEKKKKKLLAGEGQESRKRPASSLPEAAEDENEEDDARPAKRAKGNDSGYTSPELELGVEVDNIPDKAGRQLVLDIHPPSQVDPNDYQLFTASQLSSQNSSQLDSTSHTDSNEASSGKVLSQRTIPDSQATGESELSSTIPEIVLASQSQGRRVGSLEREEQQALDSQVASEQSQQAEGEQQVEEHQQKVGQSQQEEQQRKEQQKSSWEEPQVSKTLDHDEETTSESLIPSRQPDPLHQPVNHNTPQAFRDENNHSQSSSVSGFLTQPDYPHLSNDPFGGVESAVAEAYQGSEVNRDSQVAISQQRRTPAPIENSSIPSVSNAPRADSPQVTSLEISSSSWQSQQAQLVDSFVPLSSHLNQIRTQSQELSQRVEEFVPETAQKERTLVSNSEHHKTTCQ
ncbi:uncharacterized protein QC763_0042650 [Podospora pseudopauciseta]|uniref:Chromo domain-containing protein n=1 Tax=Podospora pseudopauciseta TaxID=2093780 RepID=A0ABR0HQN8_9PEZI|nr:hypothetical protein QC763_0042650 [Podospora pseudopauciseta]